MKANVEACVSNRGRFSSDWKKGAEYVDAGGMACYYSDQAKMLSKIYGKEKVDSWEGNKIHSVYRSLIGREYSAMLREEKNRGGSKKSSGKY